jgi:hypothetical protein
MSLTQITRTVVSSISSFFNINNTTGAITTNVPDLIGSNTTLYPSFACRSWVNFDGRAGITSANISSLAYSQSGFVITVTLPSHGHLINHFVRLTFQSGTASAENFTVTSVIDVNTFTVTSTTSRTTSGTCTSIRCAIRSNGNTHSVAYLSTGDYGVNMNSIPDANYSISSTAHQDSVDTEAMVITVITRNTVSFRIRFGHYNGGTYNLRDCDYVGTGVFR